MVRAAVALVALLLLPSAGYTQKRVALVVGNSAYQHTPRLANPKNDATDIAAALKKHGVHVLEGFDLDKAAFDRKVRDFATALKGAEVGLFFFAGHGLQVEGQNYLVPVDAELTNAATLEFEMLRLDIVHRVMERQTNTNIIFLDACRDNPLTRNLARAMGTRSPDVGKGLAPVESGVGTLISFSTQPGNAALDGTGRNSPFAGALAKHIAASRDDLSAILIAVRNDVMKETQRKQVPWEHSALTGRFYFVPPATIGSSLLQQHLLLPEGPISDLFAQEDLMRVGEVAGKKHLPLPAFKIYKPDDDVSESIRRFVGIWVSDSGFRDTGRQWMTTIVSVNREGKAWGYHSRGPPMPNSIRTPAAVIPFTGTISGDTLSYSTSDGKIELSFTVEGRLRYHEVFTSGPRSGGIATVILHPVWTLVQAERAAKR